MIVNITMLALATSQSFLGLYVIILESDQNKRAQKQTTDDYIWQSKFRLSKKITELD